MSVQITRGNLSYKHFLNSVRPYGCFCWSQVRKYTNWYIVLNSPLKLSGPDLPSHKNLLAIKTVLNHLVIISFRQIICTAYWLIFCHSEFILTYNRENLGLFQKFLDNVWVGPRQKQNLDLYSFLCCNTVYCHLGFQYVMYLFVFVGVGIDLRVYIGTMNPVLDITCPNSQLKKGRMQT